MAAKVRLADTQDSLLKLADRIDALANQRERVVNGGGSEPGGRADLSRDHRHGGGWLTASCGLVGGDARDGSNTPLAEQALRRKVDDRSLADCTFVIAATPGHAT